MPDDTATDDGGLHLPSAEMTETRLSAFRDRLSAAAFSDFHRRQERAQNEEEGYGDTRNVASYTPPPDTHSPSSLLSCSRMEYYRAANAPSESSDPHGIFKWGHTFEAYVKTFLREDVAPDGIEVRNAIQIEYEVDGLTFTGTTDPVLFDSDGTPVLLTEVKTISDLYYISEDGAKRQHLAQAHAYARGLQDRYNLESPPPILFIYGDRTSLDTEFIPESFDPAFWAEVLEWAEANSGYRKAEILPPKLTEDDDADRLYMCSYCDYAARCKSDQTQNQDAPRVTELIQTGLQDVRERGFLPLTRYPEDMVISHLATYPTVPLTPTVASQYPAIIDDDTEPPERLKNLYGAAPQCEVADWRCPACEEQFEYGRLEWSGDLEAVPTCPLCDDTDEVTLRGPRPSDL